MLGGGKEKVVQLKGNFSRQIEEENILCKAEYLRRRTRLTEKYEVDWKAKGDREAKLVDVILSQLERDGCPDLFLSSFAVNKQWETFDNYKLKNITINVHWEFYPHPFKPSTFHRLKGRMPSFQLYSRMKELRKILSTDLDKETRKRWRDILLINYPHEQFSNQEIRQIWKNCPWILLLKESRGKFVFMEVDESKEV